ncbi:uncharacterized protein LOC118561850 [Fundulus heteroclitus]|uniref:uncharacterized protein LOC118561850 n=1 Tax=Fundulus heteroclitus TaxID=8078 RepID=UPI00165A7BB1|nr:uncharacterized protein LOC118561850 [Fundulus heteroclitus]
MSEMEKSEEPVGPLDGQFEYKTNKDGTINKHVVVCSHCKKDFSFHRSTSSLKYHLNAKHTFVGASTSGVTPGMRQTTLTERRALSKSTSEKLNDKIARWIAKDCRPINIVEDTGLAEVLKVATLDAFYKPPSRGTVMTKINELYVAKMKTKEEDLASAEHMPCIAHMLQRSINVSLSDSGFTNVLAKCRKIVGHFRHRKC